MKRSIANKDASSPPVPDFKDIDWNQYIIYAVEDYRTLQIEVFQKVKDLTICKYPQNSLTVDQFKQVKKMLIQHNQRY